MSWHDRDYAQSPTPRHGVYVPGAGAWTQSVVNVLLAINIGVFVLCWLTGGAGSWIYSFGWMETDLVLGGQFWRLITSQYLHAPDIIFHIAFNMLGLHFLGRPLEQLWGNRRFFLVYTLAGLTGNVFLILAGVIGWFPSDIPAVGASGCILGLLGVCAVLFPTARVIVIMFPMTIRSAALLFTTLYVFNVLSGGWNAGGDVCHLGGLAFGVLWAKYIHTGRITLPRMARPARKPRFKFTFRPASKSDSPAPDQAEVDRILNKIQTQGVASLTRAEKATLQRATDHERELDRRYGRTDRL